MSIPAEFHTYWPSEHVPEFSKPWIDSWKKMHPNGKIRIWNDMQILESMKSQGSEFLSLFQVCRSLYGRLRIAQYHILEAIGGVFFDLDTRCLKSLNEFLTHGKGCFFALEPKAHAVKYSEEFIVGTAVIGSVAHHPLWKAVADTIRLNQQANLDDPEMAYGSVMLTKVVRRNQELVDAQCDAYDAEVFYPIACSSTIEEIKRSSMKDAYCIHYWKDFVHPSALVPPREDPSVLVCILARNKGHLLDLYLKCIEALDYPKDKMHLFIHTNDNRDNTVKILLAWIARVEVQYGSVEIKYGSNRSLEDDNSAAHSWGSKRVRLDVLAKIRQNSLLKVAEKGCRYYFVADCDNFLLPHTLKDLIACQKPIVAPLLHCVGSPKLSNFFLGAMISSATAAIQEKKVLMKERGIFPAMVVHNTYLVDARYIPKLSYEGREGSFEFANFSVSAKKQGIGQYVCNKRFYGIFLHFYQTAENEARLLQEKSASIQQLMDAMADNRNHEVQILLREVAVDSIPWMKRMGSASLADPSSLK